MSDQNTPKQKPKKIGKERLDVLLFQRDLAPSREKAQAMIIAGLVLVDDYPQTKPGQKVSEDAAIRVKGKDHPYVSRGGLKLAAAFDHYPNLMQEGFTAIDVGASTGGFTDVMLRQGADKVYAVDVRPWPA